MQPWNEHAPAPTDPVKRLPCGCIQVAEPPPPRHGYFRQPGPCVCCGLETSGGNYCNGCGAYVCWSCDAPVDARPFGPHTVSDHQRFRVHTPEDDA